MYLTKQTLQLSMSSRWICVGVNAVKERFERGLESWIWSVVFWGLVNSNSLFRVRVNTTIELRTSIEFKNSIYLNFCLKIMVCRPIYF